MMTIAICPNTEARTFQEKLQKAESQLSGPRTDLNRFYNLSDAAKASFELGAFENARKYSMELLALAPQFKKNWNYGNAIHDGNVVLGRLALRENKINEAINHLLTAGKTPGSPQLDSFGPNLSLAKDLLEKGQREAVIQYLDLCAKFWEKQFNEIDKWKTEIRAGKVPEFGANLVY